MRGLVLPIRKIFFKLASPIYSKFLNCSSNQRFSSKKGICEDQDSNLGKDKPQEPKSCPFDHSGIPACFSASGKTFDPRFLNLTFVFVNPNPRTEFSAIPHKNWIIQAYKKFYKHNFSCFFEDGHSSCVIPKLIPNLEVKPTTPSVLVSEKMRTRGAVSFFFFINLITWGVNAKINHKVPIQAIYLEMLFML